MRFCTTGHCITKVGLSNVCTHNQEGTEYQDPIFPFKISFEPNPEVSFPDAAPGSMTEFLDQFKAIPVGTKLYTIKAIQNPENPIDSILGNLVIADECVSSNFGDTEMFFKHQWIEDDIALRPEWIDNYSEDCYCNFPKTTSGQKTTSASKKNSENGNESMGISKSGTPLTISKCASTILVLICCKINILI